MASAFPIGDQWPTKDPFLFVAHHRDAYPAGDDRLGPAEPLGGRSIGNDFAGINGWNMYHGSTVPGFPQHPHRGFETVTHLRVGAIDHSDSLGATARFGPGDTQWMTAGAGIVHSEMFPLLNSDADNPLELFQIWLNLPSVSKMVPPYFTMMWAESTSVIVCRDDAGGVTELTTIAGAYGDRPVAEPPPDSWAGRAEAEVAIWHLTMTPGARWTLPAASAGVERTLYAYSGTTVAIGGDTEQLLQLEAGHGVELGNDELELAAGAGGIALVLLQGRPIGEPVAQYGPFVMNDRAGLEQAVHDYQRTQFGGWPWKSDDPTHARDAGRFAVHPDGRRDHPEAAIGAAG